MDQLIGFKLKKIREIKNYSQDYVADKLSVSQSTYSDIENGKRNITEQELQKIAETLDITPEVIKGFSEQIFLNFCKQSGVSNTYHISSPIEKINELYQDLIFQLKLRVEDLERENRRLRKLLGGE